MSEISGLVSSLGTLTQIAKALAELRDFQQLNAKVIEMQQVILAAQQDAISMQQQHAVLTSRIRELEEECVNLKDWGAEKERYAVREIARGVFAYVEHSSMGPLQSAHKLCSNCFEQGKKSLLQRSREPRPLEGLVCHRCNKTMVFRHYADQA